MGGLRCPVQKREPFLQKTQFFDKPEVFDEAVFERRANEVKKPSSLSKKTTFFLRRSASLFELPKNKVF